MGGKSNAYNFGVGKLKERDHLEDVSIDDSVVLKPVLKK